MLEVKVEGLKELDAALKKLPWEIEKKVLWGAMYAGTKPIIRAAQSKAPVADEPHYFYEYRRSGRAGSRKTRRLKRTDPIKKHLIQPGNIRRNIRAKRLKDKLDYFTYLIGPMKKGKWSSGYLEDPWYWRFHEFGTKHFSARPFLGPGFDASIESAINVVKISLRKGIDRAVKKLGLER